MKRFALLTVLCAAAFLYFFSTLKSQAPQTEEILAPFPPGPTSPTAGPILEENRPEGSVSEFHRLTEETFEKLPRVQEFNALSKEQVHHTPSLVLRASPALAKIYESLKNHPELVPQGIEFFENCARNSDVVDALRIVCLRDLKYWIAKQPEITQVRENDYPTDLWRISSRLPPVIP